jgi:hypothetical protein
MSRAAVAIDVAARSLQPTVAMAVQNVQSREVVLPSLYHVTLYRSSLATCRPMQVGGVFAAVPTAVLEQQDKPRQLSDFSCLQCDAMSRLEFLL